MKRKLSLLAMLAIIAVVAVTVGYSASGHTTKFPKKAHITIPYDLPAGGIMDLPTIPPGVPVTIDGVCTTPGLQGIGSAKIHRVASTQTLFKWVASDMTTIAVVKTGSGSDGSAGAIVSFDFEGEVSLYVRDPEALWIFNASPGSRAGTVTISW